jgi:hypothetical protein
LTKKVNIKKLLKAKAEQEKEAIKNQGKREARKKRTMKVEEVDAYSYVDGRNLIIVVRDVPNSLNNRDRQNQWMKANIKKYWTGIVKKAIELKLNDYELPFGDREKPLYLSYYAVRNRYLDVDNNAASVKDLLDGAKEAGVIADDTPAYVAEYFPHEIKQPKEKGIAAILRFTRVQQGAKVKIVVQEPNGTEFVLEPYDIKNEG